MAFDKKASTQSGHGNSASKRLRNQKVDRISDLPNSVLLLILSFLPALYVARTCILSRRWQHFWTCVPCLDFGCDINYEESRGSASFVKFVNRFLLQYKGSSIHKFKLLSYMADSCDAELWMRWAINRNVKELDLCFPHLSLHLPQTTFSSKNLVVLKLVSRQLSMTAPPSACNMCLKTLELDSLTFPDCVFDNALISCCTVLENLSIQRRYRSKLKSIRVHAQQLKHLTIYLFEEPVNNHKGTGCVIDINAPTLEDLDIMVSGSCSLLLENVGVLSKAKMDLNDSKAFQSLIKYFSALESVKSLYLSSSTFTKQACHLKPGPMVHNVNLTHLTLGVRSVWVQLLPYFFHCFPNLEVLRIHQDYPAGDRGSENLCVDPELLPTGLLSRLRVFAAEEFRDSEDELSMLKYILKNGKVLDSVQIKYICSSQIDEEYTTSDEFDERFLEYECEHRALEETLRVAQKILTFPRASQNCQIKFS